ncbi:hypothetical protein NC651_009973 [Populus alba x Populus x berolinensis]|nr:hypothetical protein NC651_009973 [Populus alba x Populus x berolinensis]
MGKGKVRSYWTRVWRGSQVTILKPQGYILNSGVSGFLCYAIYELLARSPAFDLAQTRMVFKFGRDKFHYMAITDEKQGIMLMPEDLLPDRGKQLIVPESVLLGNSINPDLKGEAKCAAESQKRNEICQMRNSG